MSLCRFLVPLVFVVSTVPAQTPRPAAPSSPVDTAARGDDEGVRQGVQYGIAAGGLHYDGGLSEQAIGGVVRWAPVHFFSISASPTYVRQSLTNTVAARGAKITTSRNGLTDIPLSAAITHAFSTTYDPILSLDMGATLPVGDSASGFGSGQFGYSADVGLDVSPTDKTWLDVDLGRSLAGFTSRSAFSGASSWIDLGAGVSLTNKLSLSAGFSTDLGAVDPTDGRSSSASGGLAIGLGGSTTLNLAATRGMSGVAPSWSFALGFGTAFPSLAHLGGSTALGTLRQTFGGGTHGLKKGVTGATSGRGKGRNKTG